ncbi:molybdate ABC transporter permease subunit [Pseudoclavibacter chungangensis]|uniref:Molybdenum transport system permease n=1 Tax=Pseudoclavibacter chungangensis TaxID=587635 RepID=A0A7J5BQ93_9MICO|nr:molybdate ABC transporter permease subunit [Pseudoclavibacter chungangensis]NYJ66417.1 molybdate transport system permease protein [Pseudoclavibacter chungangensis]
MTSGRTTEALREHTRAAGRFPVWLYVPAAIGALTLLLPLAALLLRLDGPGVIASVTSPAALQALGLSISTASVATVVCLVLGVPLAFVIARSDPRLAAVLRTLTTLPLVLPPLVGGIALLSLLGRTGLFGEALGLVGIRIPFTTAAVVIAQVFVAMPFLVVSVEGALRTAGTSYEGVAAGLGAGRFTVFRRITLPLVAPGLVSGAVLCFARALGEFGATALFAGNAAGTTRTMPLAIYTAFNGAGVSEDTAIALSLMLIVVAVGVLVLMRGWRADAAR